MGCVGEGDCVGVLKNCCGFFKSHAVLLGVTIGFVCIPLKLHAPLILNFISPNFIITHFVCADFVALNNVAVMMVVLLKSAKFVVVA